ncbi:MAG: MlaD family protein [Planctomycetota bacterium]|jgi:phospholipid/cholesterol/gamma-HCH transport system substrate-binding protein
MKRTSRRHVNLGIFLLGTLALLVALSLLLTNTGLGRVTWTAYFGDAYRVKAGSEVYTSGMKVGVVDSVSLVPAAEMSKDRFVKVKLKIRKDVILWEGAVVSLGSRGLLGRSVLELYRGRPVDKDGNPVPRLRPETPLRGIIAPGLFDDLAGFVKDNRANFTAAVASLQKVAARLEKGEGTAGRFFGPDDELYQKVDRVIDDVGTLVSVTKAQENSVGRLLFDRGTLFDDVSGAAADLKAATARMDRGEGPLGVLLKNDEVAQQLKDIVGMVTDRMRSIERGEGSLGKLIVKDEIYDRLFTGVGALSDFAVRLQEGKGTVSQLLDDDGAIYANIARMSDNLALVTDDVRAGRGTLGKLLADEGIYEELMTMLQTFRETGDVARENAPLTSLVSFSALFFNVLN